MRSSLPQGNPGGKAWVLFGGFKTQVSFSQTHSPQCNTALLKIIWLWKSLIATQVIVCWLQERRTGEQLPRIVSKVYLTSTYSNLKKKTARDNNKVLATHKAHKGALVWKPERLKEQSHRPLIGYWFSWASLPWSLESWSIRKIRSLQLWNICEVADVQKISTFAQASLAEDISREIESSYVEL